MKITMREKELDRALVLRNVLDKSLSKVKAESLLHILERHVRGLLIKLQARRLAALKETPTRPRSGSH